jgi:uncharacterized protein YdiU (UPF0061 family)
MSSRPRTSTRPASRHARAAAAIRRKARRARGDDGDAYAAVLQLDGRHPFKDAVPGGFVDYQARTRRDGRVAYFNFDLAVEMGLIPPDHPRRLTPALRKVLLETFSVRIINEYDMIHGTPVAPKDVRPHRYMATRYLQLQHADQRGTTSGDGRSVWNGSVTHRGKSWDVSSCGTGATCLSPATAKERRFFKTDDRRVAYGSGTAELDEGLGAAILSEILHRRGVPTERTLAIISFGKTRAINVRAAPNLLRPSHFFLHLRQGNYAALKGAVDYFIARQAQNGDKSYGFGSRTPYQDFADRMAVTFARSAAIFESDYLFVWMDWDGDNILASGGIIDYGSVRQFGLFHQEYRYDDHDRMSTSLVEQRNKARGMVQTFAQLRDYLLTGVQRPRAEFAMDKTLKLFDRTFEETLASRLLQAIGFDAKQRDFLLRHHRGLVARFRAVHSHFERAKSRRGPYRVEDGVTWDAIYCMRDVLRELPRRILAKATRPTLKELMGMMASSYATAADRRLTGNKARRMQTYLKLYEDLVAAAAAGAGKTTARLMLEVAMRSGDWNRAERITGNAALMIAARLAKESERLPSDGLQRLVETLIEQQIADPAAAKAATFTGGGKTGAVAKACLRLITACKDGI